MGKRISESCKHVLMRMLDVAKRSCWQLHQVNRTVGMDNNADDGPRKTEK